MLTLFRRHLAWKLFLSYVIVVLVGVVVLATATSFSVPAAFERHMAGMSAMMPGMMGNSHSMEMELFANYRASVTEALSLAVITALIAAVVASYFISRQVVNPIRTMMNLSHRIAEGEYKERLTISGDLSQLDELDQLALSFNQMADKLEKTETMRRQLIGDVAHELRTPLAAIKGYIEGLMDGVIPAEGNTYQQIHDEINRLQRLVDDLQELSRVESGAFHLKPELVSLSDLMDTIQNIFVPQFIHKGIQFQIQIEPNLPPVLIDKDRILQVLTNLVGNALQYTPSGGKVTVQISKQRTEILISVSDTGIGISPEHLPFIFNRFYRTDKSRARASGGSGIGLTIAQALVKAHHGRIWAESGGEGKGSTFYFTLPIPKKNL
ncbi:MULTISPECIES: sensor histidine kinase [Anaerolinea]|uniref:histidine kinase n=1 Tax=Anaerolinea thermophila (strain DSM 14523 / JCM 11388 / NBRC 100420 / UNI-1) TaxID=926569 RepID=E8N0D4_ANATU|nr:MULTISPECIES: ATP-binding protein [Anaerolinea]BAJ64683.1 two-component sensor histidine kinase [Anaerolinea thermophila UNI-1]